jgi:nondiscriminating aspartyl-tRNA synthetase
MPMRSGPSTQPRPLDWLASSRRTSVNSGRIGILTSFQASTSGCSTLSWPPAPAQIPRIHFHDAQKMIEAATGERIVGEPDLAPAHERWLGEWAAAEYGSEFVFVECCPMAKRPFYTHPDPARPEYSNSFDLLFRSLELVTGGQRLHQHHNHLAVVDVATQEALAGYLDAFC